MFKGVLRGVRDVYLMMSGGVCSCVRMRESSVREEGVRHINCISVRLRWCQGVYCGSVREVEVMQ